MKKKRNDGGGEERERRQLEQQSLVFGSEKNKSIKKLKKALEASFPEYCD